MAHYKFPSPLALDILARAYYGLPTNISNGSYMAFEACRSRGTINADGKITDYGMKFLIEYTRGAHVPEAHQQAV